ncbi:SRPBCC family protein, partial [Streptomyces sp. ME02-6977A]|nr:SRPBCC family protein [Streptomyces sp. ME02-6977A]
MAVFSLERTVPLTPDEAWRRLTRWERHGDTVPLTRVTFPFPPSSPSPALPLFTPRGPPP